MFAHLNRNGIQFHFKLINIETLDTTLNMFSLFASTGDLSLNVKETICFEILNCGDVSGIFFVSVSDDQGFVLDPLLSTFELEAGEKDTGIINIRATFPSVVYVHYLFVKKTQHNSYLFIQKNEMNIYMYYSNILHCQS